MSVTRPRRLPMVLSPASEESLPSYVARMASMYTVPTADMLTALGLTDIAAGRPRIVGYGTLLAGPQRMAMQDATDLTEQAIAAMLLTRYDGLAADLSALDHDDPRSFVAVARRQWLLFRSSRLCPACLHERDGAWRLSWKLPWRFACREHCCLLLEACPACGHPHGHGTGDSCLPPFTGSVPEPLNCSGRVSAPEGDVRRGLRSASRQPCGQPLAELPTVDLRRHGRGGRDLHGPTGGYGDRDHVGQNVLAAQAVIDDVLASGGGRVAGEGVSALEYFAEARSLYSLLLHHGRADDLGPMPSELVHEVSAFTARRDALRSGAGPERSGPRKHLVMYRRTLTSVPVTAALAPTVTRLLAAESAHALSDRLGELARRVHDRHRGRIGLRQYYGVSARLEAALLAAMPRRRSRIWVKSELDRLKPAGPETGGRRRGDGGAADAAELARFVPALLWPDVWQQHFAHLILTRLDWPARRFLSMQLIKLATQCSWEQAAAALDYRDIRAGVAVGYVNRATREGTVDALRSAAELVLDKLGAPAPGGRAFAGRVDYGKRRETFAGLTRIETSAWNDILTRARMRDTNKRRYCAAVWLWSELTGGYPTDAPGWAGTPTRAVEMYRQFLGDTLPDLREPLLDHGRALLLNAGDSQPRRAELTLH